MKRKTVLSVLILVIGAMAFTAAGCGGEEEATTTPGTGTEAAGGGGLGDVQALPSSSCADPVFEGAEDADILIASDLPRQGGSRFQTSQMVAAIQLVLEQRGWKAGDKYVAYQDCDDSTAQAAKWDPGKCSQNANAYAGDESLVAVIGTFNSGCAAIEIPVLNQAPGGGLLLLSPANTYGCLTEPCAGNEPEKYYPTGKRTYARVAPSDPNQGAVQAQLMQEAGVKSVYILNDKEAYGLGVAKNVRGAVESVGIEVKGFAAFDPTQPNFEAVFEKIKGTDPDAIFIGGLVDENSGQLINDKVSVLGPNTDNPDDGVMLFLPDGYATDSVFDPEQGGTENAKGAIFTVAGAPIDQFTGPGGEFAKELQDSFTGDLEGEPVDPYAIFAAQAAVVVLDSIEQSDGSRTGIIDAVFQGRWEDALIGSFEFNENGDVVAEPGAPAVTFVVYKGTNKLVTEQTIDPDPKLVDAARAAAG